MKVEFNVKYGKNVIDIPITDATKPKFRPYGKQDKFTDKITIYNDISSDGVNPRRFDRFVIDKCMIYEQLAEKTDGTIQNIVNARNVITKDVEHYKTPLEYAKLPSDIKDMYYTVQVNDFIVLAEVDDIVTNSREFQALQEKYKDNAFFVTAVSAYTKGNNTNNIHIMHA